MQWKALSSLWLKEFGNSWSSNILALKCFYGDGHSQAPATPGATLGHAHRTGWAPGHPFYKRFNELLDGEKFDEFCERECAQFYANNNGRPSLTPGTYFRLLLIGYFEGIDSERGIAWRTADSLGLREFLRIGLDEQTPIIRRYPERGG
ncbi:MAG: transposase [Acidobacteriota bacterium]|nr:transposase [Acidobacteriota bacterium]